MTFLPFLLNRSRLPICSYNFFLFWPVPLKSVKKKKKKKKKIYIHIYINKNDRQKHKKKEKKKNTTQHYTTPKHTKHKIAHQHTKPAPNNPTQQHSCLSCST